MWLFLFEIILDNTIISLYIIANSQKFIITVKERKHVAMRSNLFALLAKNIEHQHATSMMESSERKFLFHVFRPKKGNIHDSLLCSS